MVNLKYLLFVFMLSGVVFAQSSSFTIGGSGTSATSAHLTITNNAYQCLDDYIVQEGATLTIWDESAICGCENGSIIYNTATGKFNFCENGIWVEK